MTSGLLRMTLCLYRRLHFLNLGQAVLKNAPEDVHADLALEVVVRKAAGMDKEHVVADCYGVEHGIRFKKTTIVCEHVAAVVVLVCVAYVYALKEGLEERVKRLRVAQLFKLRPVLYDAQRGIGGQQVSVLAEKHEKNAVEQLLRLFEKRELVGSGIVPADVLKKRALERGVVGIKAVRDFFFFAERFVLEAQGYGGGKNGAEARIAFRTQLAVDFCAVRFGDFLLEHAGSIAWNGGGRKGGRCRQWQGLVGVPTPGWR